MSENNVCPCCGRHCSLSAPQCEHGKLYSKKEFVSEDNHQKNQYKPKNIRQTESYKAMDIDNRLIINLRDIGHMIRFLFEGKGSQKRVLIILYEAGNMTQRELTEKIGIQPGSASEVIGKLESAGLIKRKPSKADRRTADIELTKKGLLQAKEAAKQRKKRHKEMFSGLSSDEKNTLLTIVENLNLDWDRRYCEIKKDFTHYKHEKPRDTRLHDNHHNKFNHQDI